MKAGWQTSTLGDTCELYQPKTISGKELVEDGAYPVFGANGVIGRYDKFNHEEPQLLITCRGATCGSVNISEPKSWITGNAMVVRPKNISLEMRFLEYLFRGGLDISKAITGAAQPQITRTNLAPLEINYPVDVAEQQRIVGILDEAFDGIATAKANAEQNLQNARALFESHLQSVFTQRGEGWELKTLGDVCEATQGVQIPKSEQLPTLLPGYRRYLYISDFESDKNLKYVRDEHPKKLVTPDDIIVANTGSAGKIFRGIDGILSNNLFKVSFAPAMVDRDFIFFFVTSGLFREYQQSIMRGTANPHMGHVNFKSTPISIPGIEIQKIVVERIHEFAEETQRLESLYQCKLAALDELKKSLLYQAFSGAL